MAASERVEAAADLEAARRQYGPDSPQAEHAAQHVNQILNAATEGDDQR